MNREKRKDREVRFHIVWPINKETKLFLQDLSSSSFKKQYLKETHDGK